MLKKFLRELLYFSFSREEVVKLRPQIMEKNLYFARVWASFQVLYWGYCLLMSLSQADFLRCRDIYIAALGINFAALILSLFASRKRQWLIRVSLLTVEVSLLFAGVFIARHLAPKTIVIFASVLIAPVMFVQNTLLTVLLFLGTISLFGLLGPGSLDAETFRWTITNQTLFATIGIVLGHFVNRDRFERFHFAQSAVQLAELQTRYAYYDQMTGFRNRRAYAEKLDELKEALPADLCVIMADINGLKKANDTLGHEAGDELIIAASDCFRQSFPADALIYRIGGDEFCIMQHGTAEQAEEHLKKLAETGAKWNGRCIKGVSISSGVAAVKEFPALDELIRTADKRMYEAKSEYYRQAGMDRRRR